MKRYILLAIMTALLTSWGEKEHTYSWEDVRLYMIDEGEHAFFGIQDDSLLIWDVSHQEINRLTDARFTASKTDYFHRGLVTGSSNIEFVLVPGDGSNTVIMDEHGDVLYDFESSSFPEVRKTERGVMALIRETGLTEVHIFKDGIYNAIEEVRVVKIPHELEVYVYPNPVSELLSVNLDEDYQLIDLTGAVQKSGTLQLTDTINVSDLSEGLYILRIGGKTLKVSVVN